MSSKAVITTMNEPDSSRRRIVRQGTVLYQAGATGHAYRLVSGSVRLDQNGDAASTFAGLAMPGDVIGAETMMLGQYSFSARALSDCELLPWPEGQEALTVDAILAAFADSERRAAQVVALRCGLAIDRVKQLVAILARPGNDQKLPPLGDIADITALRKETVSRILGTLLEIGLPGVRPYRRRKATQVATP